VVRQATGRAHDGRRQRAKKADELTKGADTPTEKARRLYDFVAPNIRYVSISLGVGRYQPHSASDVPPERLWRLQRQAHALFRHAARRGHSELSVLINSSRKWMWTFLRPPSSIT